MTSFTRKLYNLNPAAAEDFHRAQQFEHRIKYGKHVTLACFTPEERIKPFEHNPIPKVEFGKRQPDQKRYACDRLCDHPACRRGCSLRRV